ncbi:hypothetical protein VA596_50045 [Amycolatopsis sp., V23-08]|uniref:Helix-turn-helix domain-containing protein n=1 Tax=Amycolatopsis heterodermiae TaxID=3110235 RepID=A0ABU5RPC8_9PSEU|nr:hypothetical protein [Amycolatopsis sp., V23-08]MEA5367754.1 hypothetical protein [Amycolatopsis sp., V23-08]
MTTRTTSRPADVREFVRVSVDIAHHPKIIAMGDPAAAWGYAAAMAYAGKYHTDGWITVRTIAHEGGISVQKARKLVAVGLVHEHGHTCEKCPEVPKGQAYLHDYLEHNRSRSEVDEHRRSAAERGRRGAAKRWGNPPADTPETTPNPDSNSYSGSHGTSNGKNMAEVEEEITTHLPDAPHVPTARENDHEQNRPATGPAPSGPRSVQAYKLVDRTIGKRIPSATRTALAFEAVALLDEFDEPTIGAALTRWNQKTGVGPKLLPSLVADIVKEADGAGATLVAGGRASRAPSGRGAKVRGWLELGQGDGAAVPVEPFGGGMLVDAPYLTIEAGGQG